MSERAFVQQAWRQALISSEQAYADLMKFLKVPIDHFDKEVREEVAKIFELKSVPSPREARSYLNDYIRGDTPPAQRFGYAVESGDTNAQKYLERHFPGVRAEWEKLGIKKESLYEAVLSGDIKRVEEAKSDDILDGVTTLINAAELSDPSILDLLLKSGADINTDEGVVLAEIMLKDMPEETQSAIIRRLLERGADISLQRPSLIVVANERYLPYLPYLNYQNNNEMLSTAIDTGNVGAVEFLLNNTTFLPEDIDEFYEAAASSDHKNILPILDLLKSKLPSNGGLVKAMVGAARYNNLDLLGRLSADVGANTINAVLRELETRLGSPHDETIAYLDAIAKKFDVAPYNPVKTT